jgi:5'-nucleotidase
MNYQQRDLDCTSPGASPGAMSQPPEPGPAPQPSKKILYLDMDGVLVDFESGLARVPPEILAEYGEHRDRIPGIFSLMDPMPGALAAYRELCGLFDTFILSTAPWENPSAWIDKRLWAKRYLGDLCTKRLILTHRKDLNRGDFLVDDRPHRGRAEEFQGELIHFGSERFPDWQAVLAYLREAAEP